MDEGVRDALVTLILEARTVFRARLIARAEVVDYKQFGDGGSATFSW